MDKEPDDRDQLAETDENLRGLEAACDGITPGEGSRAEQILQNWYGRRVTVTNPDTPDATWTGVLTGIYNEPVLTLLTDDGTDRPLPQRFHIADAGPDEDAILARYAAEMPDLAAHQPVCGDCMATHALGDMRGALRVVLLPWLEAQDDPERARRLRNTLETALDEIEDQIDLARGAADH